MTRQNLAEHNVIAVLPNQEAARAAVLSLERAGIDAKDISVVARQDGADTREPDLHVTERTGKRVAKGGAAGTAAGGVAGFVAGAIAFGIPGVGPVVGTGVWAATIGGAIGGGAVGGVVGGVSGLGMGEAWETTYESLKNGRVVVAVHADVEEHADRAQTALLEQPSLSVERFDAEGRRLGPE